MARTGGATSIEAMDSVLDLLHQTMSSPWVYLALFAIAVVDGFFPAVPSETAVITAGVFAATGQPDLPLVIVVAACGALVGDHVSYAIGRHGGGRLLARLPAVVPGSGAASDPPVPAGSTTIPGTAPDTPSRNGGKGSRRRAAVERARRGIAARGGLLLVVARYIPGGRTAVTLTMGATRFSRRRFLAFDALAAASWGVYSALVGYLGGLAFERDPVRGLLLGLGLAVSVTLVVETVRWVRGRRRAHADGPLRRPAGAR